MSFTATDDIKDLQSAYTDLREYLTEDELAEMDRLLWNPTEEIKRYRVDPVAFANEVLKIKLTPYQEKILVTLCRRKRCCVRGPRGLGKTTIAAVAILWFLATREECKVATITGVWRQLIEFLWPEVQKWALKAEWWRVGLNIRKDKEIFGTKIEITKNRMAFAMASDDPEKIEGAHSKSVLVIFDESKIIPEAVWDSAEGVLTTEDSFALAISTPGDSLGRFYDIQMKKPGFEDWAVVAVTIDEAIAAGRVQRDWVNQRRAAWGERSVMFCRQVLGQFKEDESETIIVMSDIEKAVERWHERERLLKELIESGVDGETAEQQIWGTITRIGVDPARFGVDKTGFSFCYGPYGIRKVSRTRRQDLTETADVVMGYLDTHETAQAAIDVNGLGAGVYDICKKAEYNVYPVMVTHKTSLRDETELMQFATIRDWLWWRLREILSKPDSTFCLPPDEELHRDLLAGKLAGGAKEKLRVIDKEAMRKIIGRSPDVGEAVLYAIAPEEAPYRPMIGFL